MWCDLGFVPNSRGNKVAANLRPSILCKEILVVNCDVFFNTPAASEARGTGNYNQRARFIKVGTGPATPRRAADIVALVRPA